jgi:hypothetical protein
MKKVIDAGEGTITFSFTGLAPVVFRVERASAANREYATLHGFSSRIGDHAALERGKSGGTITEQMRRDAVCEITAFYGNVANVSWDMARNAKMPEYSPACKALAVKLGIGLPEAAAKLEELMLAQIAAM